MGIWRRTGRERFNPMQVWLRPAERLVVGEYEVRAHGDPGTALAEARALLDARLSGPLAKLGLAPDLEAVEEWGGQVLILKIIVAYCNGAGGDREQRCIIELIEVDGGENVTTAGQAA